MRSKAKSAHHEGGLRRSVSRRKFLRATAGASLLAAPGLISPAVLAAASSATPLKLEDVIPAKALVTPRKPRKLLIFDLNVGYGGHASIATANQAFTLMGQKTGAFSTVVSRDPSIFQPASLKQFDAVFLNNNVGNLFTDPELRESLVQFIYAGGGLMGVHGTTVAFTKWPGAIEDWPEFGIMLGARGANHRDSDEHLFVRMDEPDHPLNQALGGKDFDYRDEFFRVHGPYSRNRVRVLFSIDTVKSPNQGQPRGNIFREDNDYALAWVRQYGRGRVFYCTIAHNPSVFRDPKMLQFYLAAIQFAVGDLPAPTLASAKLTPAVRAQERLGWRLGLMPQNASGFSLAESVIQTAVLGLNYIGASDVQKLEPDSGKQFNARLERDDLRAMRLKLDAASVRLLSCHVSKPPGDTIGWRQLFAFSRKMGLETVVANPPAALLDGIEKLCQEYELNLALPCDPVALRQRDAGALMKSVTGRTQRLGLCLDLRDAMSAGLDALEAVRLVQDRLLMVRLCDQDQLSSQGREVPLGRGAGKIEACLDWLRKSAQPIVFAIASPGHDTPALTLAAESVKWFNQKSLE